MIFKKHTKQILQQTIPYLGKKYGHRLIKYETFEYFKRFHASGSCEICGVKMMASTVTDDDSFIEVSLVADRSQMIGYVDSVGNEVLIDRKEIVKSLLCNKYRNLD